MEVISDHPPESVNTKSPHTETGATPRRWKAPAESRMILFDLVLALIGVAWWLGPVHAIQPLPQDRLHLPWWAVAAIVLPVYRWSIRIPMRRISIGWGFDELPLLLGLYFSSPRDLYLGYVLGAIGADIARGVRSVWRPAVNVGLTLAGYAPAIVVFHLVVPTDDPMGWRGWLGSLAALATYVIANTGLSVLGSWVLEGGKMSLSEIFLARNTGAFVSPISAGIALLAAELLWFDTKGILLLLSPAAAVIVGYRIYQTGKRQTEAVDLLTSVGTVLSSSRELEATVLGVLSRVRSNFRSDFAQLTIFPVQAGDKAFRTTVRSHGVDEIMVPIDVGVIDSFLLPSDSDGLLANRLTAGPAVRDMLSGHGVDDAMMVVLKSETRFIGTVFVGGHTDEVDPAFSQKDFGVFVSLAHQMSKALEANQLESAVTQLTEREAELSYKAFHDPLTGLANRVLFLDRADLATKRQQRGKTHVAIVYIDLDDFKSANDTFGHGMGDKLLQAVARRLESCIRQTDTAARLGGDEFALLLEDLKSPEEAETTAARVVATLKDPIEIDGAVLSTRASLGVAIAAPPGLPAAALTKNADVAMYVAKHRGKGRFVVYDESLEETADSADVPPSARPRLVSE